MHRRTSERMTNIFCIVLHLILILMDTARSKMLGEWCFAQWNFAHYNTNHGLLIIIPIMEGLVNVIIIELWLNALDFSLYSPLQNSNVVERCRAEGGHTLYLFT